MRSGESNAGERQKTIGLLSKRATLHLQHTFLYISLSSFCTTTTWNFPKLLSYTFWGGNVVRILVHLFFTATHFHLALVAASISDFVTATISLFVCLFFFLSLALDPCRRFFSLSFAGLPPIFSISLSFSCSILQICGHHNGSKLNTLDNRDTETIPAFRFCLYWLFQNNRVVFGLPYLLIELFYIGMRCGRTVIWAVGVRSRGYQIFWDG